MTFVAICLARLSWVSIVVIMAVYIGWSSIHDDATVSGGNQDAYGGMDDTFDAYNGWCVVWCPGSLAQGTTSDTMTFGTSILI